MKITCESCQAKYTIADDKVVGKTVKIKCKKCGSAIVVQGDTMQPAHAAPADADDGAETRVFSENHAGAAAAPPMAAGTWLVNVAEGDERTMTTAQIVAEVARGALSPETYVWKDGMSDWVPISGAPELVQAAAGQGHSAAQEPAHGLMGTVVMDSAPQAGAAMAPPQAAAAVPTAARRAGARAGVDVFGAREQADARTGPAAAPSVPPPGGVDRMTGARNENSVLFSLSALTAAETAVKAQGEKAVIDMRPGPSPATGRPPPPNNTGARAGFDDIMNLGGGGIGSPMLAPPPVLAPVMEAPPPPPQHIPSIAPPMGMSPAASPYGMPDMPPKKKPVGLIVGVVGLVLVVGGVAAAALGVFSPPVQPVASNDTPQPSTQPETKPAETAAAEAKPAETAAAEAKPAETAAAEENKGSEPAAVAAAAQAGSNPRGTSPGTQGTGKTTEKEPPKDEKKPEAAPEKTAAPAAAAEGGSNEFNRGAATSALGGAAGAAKSCKKPDGPTGSGKVKVTFAPSGNVTSAQVQGAPFAGTSVGGCVASVFRSARVPPFSGAPVSVTKSFNIN